MKKKQLRKKIQRKRNKNQKLNSNPKYSNSILMSIFSTTNKWTVPHTLGNTLTINIQTFTQSMFTTLLVRSI